MNKPIDVETVLADMREKAEIYAEENSLIVDQSARPSETVGSPRGRPVRAVAATSGGSDRTTSEIVIVDARLKMRAVNMIREMHDGGVSFWALAKRYNVAPGTVHSWYAGRAQPRDHSAIDIVGTTIVYSTVRPKPKRARPAPPPWVAAGADWLADRRTDRIAKLIGGSQ